MKTLKAIRLAVLAMGFIGAVPAQSAQEPVRVALEIGAQPLIDALNEFARQAGLQLLLDADRAAEGMTAPRLSGSYTVDAALKILLEHSNLRYEFLSDRVVTVRPAKREGSASAVAGSDIRLAQTTAQVEHNDAAAAAEPGEGAFKAIPEILVKGSKVLNMDIKRSQDDARPYVIFDRGQIEQSGAANMDEFIHQKLPMAASLSMAAQPGGTNTFNATSVNLRGLGQNQTLILIDGHRTASYANSGTPNQPDLNGIPLSAIERIEVLPTTASGIYGGSATGGVINVVLRRDYDRVETAMTYGNTFKSDASNVRMDISAGFNFEGGKTNLMVAGSYSDAEPLLAGERDFFQRARAQILERNPDAFRNAAAPPLGTTTNICSANFGICSAANPSFGLGAPVPLTLKGNMPVGSSIAFIPAGYAGVASDDGAQLIAGAGQYNLGLADTTQYLGGARTALLNNPTIKSLTATLRRDLTPAVHAFLELSGSENVGHMVQNSISSTFAIPASANGNPFEQDILVTTPALGADSAARSSLRSRRALAGVLFKLPRAWQGEMDYTWSQARSQQSLAPAFLAGLSNGLTADQALQDGALNVFRDTNVFPVDFGAYLSSGALFPRADSELQDATFRLSGPVFELPGGSAVLSTLLERRRESLGRFEMESLIVPSRSQTVDSLYLESTLPLVSARNALPGIRLLELQLGGRYDRYTTVGSGINFLPSDPVVRRSNRLTSADSSLAVRYQPVSDLTLRASFGTGFLPPSVNQLVPFSYQETAASLAFYASTYGFTDPLRGNEPVGGGQSVTTLVAGNPDLGPEESATWSAGIVLTPGIAPGLRLSVDWVRIEKTDNIATPFCPFATALGFGCVSYLDYESQVPGLVTRGPASDGFEVGPVTLLNSGPINIARQTVEAYDLSLDYRFDTSHLGAFTFSLAGTRQMHNQTQVLPTSPVVETAGSLNNLGGGLRWRGNATLGWEYRQWMLAWNTNYFDSYVQGFVPVPSQSYHDLFARFRFDPTRVPRWLPDMELRLGIQNLLDKVPPSVISGTTDQLIPYSPLGDPRLRRYTLTVRAQF